MSSSLPPPEALPVATAGPSLGARTFRVFARPFQAWEGLDAHARWWFPLLVGVAVQTILLGLTFHRVLLPTMVDQWNQSVESGQMTAAQVDKIVSFFSDNPAGLALILGQQVVGVVLILLVVALVVWFGIGFVLGTRFPFRQALEVVSWASLVRLPEVLLTFAIGWSQETLKGIHFGLAVLLPEMDPPSKLHQGLSVLLDAFGPFVIWNLFVTIIGCSVLSGAPRKNVAWVLSALYLALTVVFAVVAALFAPGT